MSGVHDSSVLERDVALVVVPPSAWASVEKEILAIEHESFPPSIREEKETLRREGSSPSSMLLAAKAGSTGRVIAYLLADRVENYADVPGVEADDHFGRGDTLYISSVAVRPERRGRGLGLAMQRECFRLARKRGYRRVAAHLRQGAAPRISAQAVVLSTFENWYGTGEIFEYVVFSLQ